MSAPVDADRQHLDARLDSLQSRMPERFARVLAQVRHPRARRLRLPAGVLLMLGGVLGFLPILGFWMLPLGLAILALDVPPLRRPTARALGWIERRLPEPADEGVPRRSE